MDGFFDVDHMAYAGKLPWHGGGTYAPDLAPTPEGWAEMQQRSGCGFSCELVGLRTIDGQDVEGQFAVRCSDGYLVGDKRSRAVVGRKYQLWQQDALFRLMGTLGVKPWTAGTLMGRRKVWALGQLPGVSEVRRREGDTRVSLPFVLGDNSNDGSSNITFGLTDVEVVCWNTRALALQGMTRETGKLTARHTVSAEQVLANVAETLGLMEAAFKANSQVRQDLANAPMDAPRFATLVAQLLTGKDDPKAAVETIAKAEGRSAALYQRKGDTLLQLFQQGLGNRGNCALDALNAVTEYVDHARGRTGDVDWDTQGGSILWGAGAQLKARALQLVTAA